MEQTEGFKSILEVINTFELRLLMCGETSKQIEQYGKEAEREIEEHFGRCIPKSPFTDVMK
jgi:hypothetical protein